MKWFSIGGIISEVRKIQFPTFKELFRDSMIVVGFLLFMGIFFFLCQVVISAILGVIGV